MCIVGVSCPSANRSGFQTDSRFFPKASPMLGFSFRFSFDARERYSMLDGDGMLDGHETVEIACRELR